MAEAKTYTCRKCNSTKKLGTNFKYLTSFFSKKFQDFDTIEKWSSDLCSPCGEKLVA